MGSVGECFDNAMAESFFATLECELLDRTHFHDHHRREAQSSSSSRDGITPIVVTGALVSNPPSPSRGATRTLHETQALNRPLKRGNSTLARRLRRFTQPQLLAIDEVGYLNYDNRYADLLFEVVTRRYLHRSIIVTTNKPFSEWADVFSSAACVVTLVDRLIHRCEIVQLDGESYRLKEARERTAKRSKARSRPRAPKPRPS